MTQTLGVPALGALYSIDDGTAGKRILGQYNVATSVTYRVIDTAEQASISVTNITAGQLVKFVQAYKINDFKAAANTTAGTPDVSGTIPSGLNIIRIGCNVSNGVQINGHYQKLMYWPQSLTSNEVLAFSK